MPPPPPPSASYSLVIDDCSSGDDDYDGAASQYHRERLYGIGDVAALCRRGKDAAAPPSPRTNGGRPPIPQDAGGCGVDDDAMEENDRRDGGGEEGEGGLMIPNFDRREFQDQQRSPPAKKKKRNKGKKKKKKKKRKDSKKSKNSAEVNEGDAPDETEEEEGDEERGWEGDDFDTVEEVKEDRSESDIVRYVAAATMTAPPAESIAVADGLGGRLGRMSDTSYDLDSGIVCDRLATAAVIAADGPSETMDVAVVDPGAELLPRKPRSARSISFGVVTVREYARTLGTHVVPADGGWPLGLSDEVVAENRVDGGRGMDAVVVSCVEGDNGISGSPDPTSPPRRRSRFRSRSDSFVGSPSLPSSPSTAHHYHRPTSWTVDDFEIRRQIELRQRYAQLIRDQRRRKFEKEWEKRNISAVHNRHGQCNNIRRGRSRSGSFGGYGGSVGGVGRSRAGSSSFKVEMTPEDREALDGLLNRPVTLPTGELETRPYDYKKRICHARKSKGGPKGNNNGGGVDWQGDTPQHDYTEDDELYHDYGGHNPLFRAMREDDRRKVLLRDDHLMTIRRHSRRPMVDDSMKAYPSPSEPMQKIDAPPSFIANDDEYVTLDPADGVVTQRLQQDLEALRIRRSDLSNLGCSCRKLHVFLPGSTDRSHHRKKTSHRRLPERKLREELRKRGLLHGGTGDEGGVLLSREDMEVLLHDAIENEPCCWGNDCPCWRDGIGCQADTCSCWHASHDVGCASAFNSSASKQNTAVITATMTVTVGEVYTEARRARRDGERGTIEYAYIGQYAGESKHGKPHGQGITNFANGDECVREWKDGKPHGYGTLKFADGRQYVGEWRDGKPHGHGTLKFTDGDEYVGEWKDGKPHGQGTSKCADGEYVGEWKMASLMARVPPSTLMENTLENGRMASVMAMAPSSSLMETNTLENGRMASLMVVRA
ncbi:hypothetical protein ACHAXA_002491 [Cyclostephanos tholiformis]|uniref:Uncharacterized protein n=1 Tax=Cyclostephanos tholiformis TaxID=382380 RepID=A0ABD3RZU6_9STRA